MSMMGLLNITTENSTLASQPWKNGLTYWASFEFYPEWKGRRFDIFRGIAHHERQWFTRTDVVVRTFKDQNATDDHWSHYRRCAAEARKLALHFNHFLTSFGIPVQMLFTIPAFGVMDNISEIMNLTRFLMRFKKRFGEDEVVAFEEHIEGDFKHFVDEEGHVLANGLELLEAFCHFSYHQSNGEYIISNLKGVKNGPDHEDKPNTFHLTVPSFHSKTGAYGPLDHGETGIQEFFKNHHCSSICQSFIQETDIATPKGVPTAPMLENKLAPNEAKPNVEPVPLINNSGLVRPPSYEDSIS